MNEILSSYTSLPNLHPALVHFPIALLPVALLFDLLAVSLLRQRVWLDRAATALYAIGGVLTALAFWAGRRAADSLMGLSPREQVLVGEHHDAALLALWVTGIFVIVRVAIGLGSRPSRGLSLRVIFLPFAVAAAVLVMIAADRGGSLVFQHGIAVARADDQVSASPADGSPVSEEPLGGEEGESGPSRLVTLEDGSVTWTPLAEDSQALGETLRPADGSSMTPVEWDEPVEPGVSGLGLRVAGRSMLVLPGEFGDVQVEADLDLSGFQGAVGLAHHVRSTSDGGVFMVTTTSGEAHLAVTVDGEEDVMTRAQTEIGPGLVHFAVFAAGRHFRGLQDGEVVVHGHRPPLEEGACGLVLDGVGVVRILSLKITPIVD